MRTRYWLCFLALAAALPALAERTAVPLNDFARLGQRFTATRPLVSVSVSVPSWSDNEGGLTLTLWDSPERKQALAARTLTGIRDNEYVELRPGQPLPAGSYYWEIAERTGTTRIGLWCDAVADSPDCAYLDGQPDPKRRFLYNVEIGPPPRASVESLVKALDTGSAEQREDACRQLAVYGTLEAVPALARLLADPKLSHMARYAMESLPGEQVDEAFRTALAGLTGGPLIGVINSVAVRRDAGAVERLAALLKSRDANVVDAAAVALGQIGTPEAVAVLQQTLGGPQPLPAGLYEGALRCAGRLLEGGHSAEAVGLYDGLRLDSAPRAVQLAATRGAVLARGPEGLELLRQLLRDGDPELRGVGLWLAHHELPGAEVTLALAAELGNLSAESQALLLAALAGREDPAALPALSTAAAGGVKAVRLVAIRALPRFADRAAPGLLRLLGDPDPELVQAAQNALAALPLKAAAAVATDLLGSPDAARRRFGVTLVQRLKLAGFGEALAAALRDATPEVRLEAAKALTELGGAPQIAALRDAMVGATDAGEADAFERALAAAGSRAGDPDGVTAQLVPVLDQAAPARRAALLRVLGVVGGARALRVVLAAVAGPAGEVRAAALEVLCAWPTEAAAPELLRLAREAATPAEQLTCLRGVLRLAGSEDLAADRRLRLCQDAAGLVQRDEERRLLLSALGGIPTFEALEMVLAQLEVAATKDEACAAALGIADQLVKGPEKARLVGALERIAASASPDFATRAKALLEQAKRTD